MAAGEAGLDQVAAFTTVGYGDGQADDRAAPVVSAAVL